MEIHEETGTLKVDEGVELELKSYYCDRETPKIVSVTGLGGVAGTGYFIDYLARNHHIVTFSPRNSGLSKGHFTIDNYVSDTAKVIDHLSQSDGRRPLGIGYSTGGYALGRLLGESPLVERAVLLSPLIQMSEQNHLPMNLYFKWCLQRNRPFFPGFLLKTYPESQEKYFAMDKQRFDLDDIIPFLKSLYESSPCSKKLLSPTKVVLTGGAFTRLPISSRKLKKIREVWTSLGADVDVYSDINHWYSGSRWFSNVGDIFCLAEKRGITQDMADFLDRKSL